MEVEEAAEGKVGCWRKIGNWLKFKDKGGWLKEMKKSLSLTASIMATMTFQLGTNPPGGVLQVSSNEAINVFANCTETKPHQSCPGYSVMAIYHPANYHKFLISNGISFFASISVCLMLVSGINLNHTFPTWLLLIGMCFAITGLGYTYILGVDEVTPKTDNGFYWSFGIGTFVWGCLLACIALYIFVRSFVWCITKMKVHRCNSCK